MRIRPDESIALIVDYQTRLVPAMHDVDTLISRSCILLKGLGILNIPMIVTQQYTRGLGETVEEIRSLVSDAPVFDKITFSCYQDPDIQKAVAASGKNTVIVCGIESHVCVLQTVIDLLESGYRVVLVSDCIDSRAPRDKEAALLRARSEGAVITTSEAVLFELLQKAGSDTFKQISNLVK